MYDVDFAFRVVEKVERLAATDSVIDRYFLNLWMPIVALRRFDIILNRHRCKCCSHVGQEDSILGTKQHLFSIHMEIDAKELPLGSKDTIRLFAMGTIF